MTFERSTTRKLCAITAGVVFGLFAAGLALGARNSSGTYSLPAGNPVVSGQVISSTWANNTLGDLASETSDSLSRSGKGGMLAPLRTTDGTVTAPSHSFTSETGTGLYRIGASDLGVAIAGTKRVEITPAGVTVPDALTVTGAASAGSLAVTGGLNTPGAMATALNMNSHLINNVTDPVSAQDAATKAYAESIWVTDNTNGWSSLDSHWIGTSLGFWRVKHSVTTAGSIVFIWGTLTTSAGGSTTIGTLATGFRPVAFPVSIVGTNNGAFEVFSIATNGVVTCTSFTSGHTYTFSIVYWGS